jgi:hypothetical protein
MVFRLPEGGPVRVRTSTQSGDAPTASELEEGEISLNAADGVLYYQTAAGSIGTAGPPDAPSDGGTYARKDGNWIDIEEAANLQVRRGTAAEVAAEVLLDGEPVWANDSKLLYVGDGVTQGGIPVGKFPLDGTATAGGSTGSVRVAGSVAAGTAPGTLGLGAVDLQILRNASTQIASGDYAVAFGRDNTASGIYSYVSGRQATAAIPYERCHGFTQPGFLTGSVFGFTYTQIPLIQATDSATPAKMARLNNAGAGVPIADGTMFVGRVLVVAYLASTAADYAVYERRIVARRVSGTVTVPESQTVGSDIETDADFNVSVTADDTNKVIDVTVTGDSGKAVFWSALVEGLVLKIN